MPLQTDDRPFLMPFQTEVVVLLIPFHAEEKTFLMPERALLKNDVIELHRPLMPLSKPSTR
jgi:hypothetical protein